MLRHFFLFLALLSSLHAEEKKPNILYIMSDDHAAHAVGVYESRFSKLNPTPNIDRIGNEGIRFDKCFVTNSICTPSRAAIMTGQYAHKNGCFGFSEGLPANQHMLAIEMKKQGYETAVIGKWHLKREPANFDHYAVLKGQGNYFNPTFRIRGPEPWPLNTQQIVKYDEVHSTDAIGKMGIDWLKKRKNKKKPFFFLLQFKAPHDNFANAERYDWLYNDIEMPEPKSLFTRGNHGPKGASRYGTSVGKRNARRNMGHHMAVDPSLSDEDYMRESYQRYMKKYFRCVKGVDDQVGKVLAHLEKTGELDNTIIVYTGDQGFMLGEHDYIDKRWMYEESMQAPFLVRYPKAIKPGSVSQDLVINQDFAPTLLELAGLPVSKQPADIQGKSLVPIFNGTTEYKTRDAIYYRYWLHMAHHDNPAHMGIRTATHKLIFFYGLPCGVDGAHKEPTAPYWELYDLAKDPQEMNNIAGDAGTEKLFQDLKSQLLELRKELDDTDPEHPEVNRRLSEVSPFLN